MTKLADDREKALQVFMLDRHRMVNEEWQATKRARAAEKLVERLKKQLVDAGIPPDVDYPLSNRTTKS